jgi:predicted nucleic acid-binding protein
VLFIDTDVLAIHHLFLRDQRRGENEKFLATIRDKKPNITIHNLLELCGLFAVANQSSKVSIVYREYLEAQVFNIFFPRSVNDWPRRVEDILEAISRGHSYGDALVASAAEEGGVEIFVTWNTKHFEETINAKVQSPTMYLQEAV